MTVTALDIIHSPVFYLKHDVSEAGFCLRFQVEPTQFGPLDSASLSFRRETVVFIIIYHRHKPIGVI
jgi:hypothetical protein